MISTLKRFSIKREKEIINLYKKGMSQKEIAYKYNTWNTSIRRVLIRNNIDIISTGDRLRLVKNNPFFDLKNPETNYWLGYIAADGNVASNRPAILINTNTDPEHLDKYVNYLKAAVNKRKQLNKKYNVYEYSVGFTNPEAYNSLIKLGITPKKSRTLKVNDKLLTWDFIRGVFDGDGCIYPFRSKEIGFVIVTASPEFSVQLVDFLNKHLPFKVTCRVEKSIGKTNIYRVRTTRKDNILFIHNSMYKNALVYLDRKYTKYCSLISERY